MIDEFVFYKNIIIKNVYFKGYIVIKFIFESNLIYYLINKIYKTKWPIDI
jgi:hypothetical protein